MNNLSHQCKRLFDAQRTSMRLVLNAIDEIANHTLGVDSSRTMIETLSQYLAGYAHYKHHAIEETYLLTPEFSRTSPQALKACHLLTAQHRSLYSPCFWWSNQAALVSCQALQQFIVDYRAHLELEEALIWGQFLNAIRPIQFGEAAFALAQLDDPLAAYKPDVSTGALCNAIKRSPHYMMQ